MFIELEKKYLPDIDRVIYRTFPEYFKKVRGLNRNKKKDIPILSNDEIQILYEDYKFNGNINSRNKLIISQLKLVYLYAKRFNDTSNGSNISEDDLLGFANLSLMKLIDRYDPHANKVDGGHNTLQSYIRTWLEFNLHSDIKEYGLLVRLPINKITELTAQRRYVSKFEQKHHERPQHGDYIILNEKGIQKKVVFNFIDEIMEVYEFENDKFVFRRQIRFDLYENYEIVSENNLYGSNEDEEYSECSTFKVEIEPDFADAKKIMAEEINKVISGLSNREQESVKFFYYESEQLKKIPLLLTPDYSNPTEIKTLNRTSLNSVDIYMKKGDITERIIYSIVANNHTNDDENQIRVKSEFLMPISHRNDSFNTTKENDEFSFKIIGEYDSIEIVHNFYKGAKNIIPSIENNVLSFKIDYHQGFIFTPQTFLNNNEGLLKKLRNKLIHIKWI